MDLSPEWTQVDIEGRGLQGWMQEKWGEAPPEINEVIDIQVAGFEMRVLGQPGLIDPGFRLLVATQNATRLTYMLAAMGAIPIDDASYQALRVEAGVPASGNELTEEHTPLEVGLEAHVSLDKGCYTGQEVITRQVNYNKVSQRLVGLRLEEATAPGVDLAFEGRQVVGKVTSAIVSPRLGPIALAIVRRPFHEPGTCLSLTGQGKKQKAVVCELPFHIAPGA